MGCVYTANANHPPTETQMKYTAPLQIVTIYALQCYHKLILFVL